VSQDQPFGHDPRLVAQDRKRFIHRSDRVVLELPDITGGTPVFAASTHTFAVPYVAGGVPVSPALPVVPNRAAVLIAPRGGYTFEFAEPNLVLAYYGGGGEVADTTDLAYLGTTQVIVQGSRGDVVPLLEVPRSWRISGVSLEVGADVDPATASWIIRAQLVRRTGEVELLGAIDTSETALAAGSRYDFFAALGRGDTVDALAGDMLRLFLEETLSGPALVRPVVTIKRREL